MADSLGKAKLKCKGCNFLIKSDKLLVHLNHPNVKCKEAYSESEYSLVYDLWMQTKMAIKIQDQDKIKCKGCKFDHDKFNLLWHLNDKKVDCKKVYSKDEYQHIFEFWLFHKENPSKPPKLPFEDVPCNEMMECEGCKKMFIGGEMYQHVRNSDECTEKYLSSWDGLIDLMKRYSKLKEEEENEKAENHYFKNVFEQDYINLSEINFQNGKPFFLEYGAIEEFVKTAYDTRQKYMPDWYGTIGVLLGVENDYGYHGKELIYLPNQESDAYWRYFDEEGFNIVKNSRTFKNHPRSARILVWMTTGDCFSGYDAHTQANIIKPLSKCAITLKAKVCSNNISEVGEYGLYELNDTGIQLVQKCTYKQKKKKEIFMCCNYHYMGFDNSMFHHKQVVLTHSTIIKVKDKRDREIYDRIPEHTTIPALFDSKYFAQAKSLDQQELQADYETEADPCEDNVDEVDSDEREIIIDNEIPIEVCKGCNKTLKINTIMKHLSVLPKCHDMYTKQELALIKTRMIDFRNKARRIRRRKDSNSKSKNSEPLEEIICKGCKAKCFINTIKKHLVKKSECREQYSTQEFHNIEEKCADFQRVKRSERDGSHYKDNNRRSATSQKKDKVKLFFNTLKPQNLWILGPSKTQQIAKTAQFEVYNI